MWTCEACAGKLGIKWPRGYSNYDGGWCGRGQHKVGKGQRIQYTGSDDLRLAIEPSNEAAPAKGPEAQRAFDF